MKAIMVVVDKLHHKISRKVERIRFLPGDGLGTLSNNINTRSLTDKLSHTHIAHIRKIRHICIFEQKQISFPILLSPPPFFLSPFLSLFLECSLPPITILPTVATFISPPVFSPEATHVSNHHHFHPECWWHERGIST
jgi:hypothetical protein